MKRNSVGIFNPSWVNFVGWELKTLVIGMIIAIKAGRYCPLDVFSLRSTHLPKKAASLFDAICYFGD